MFDRCGRLAVACARVTLAGAAVAATLPSLAHAAATPYDHPGILIASDGGRMHPARATALSFYIRGNAYRRSGDTARAIVAYGEAIRLNPDDANARLSRGNAYRIEGEYDRAIADYDAVIRLNPWDPVAWKNRGVTYRLRRDYEQAIADYTQAIALEPADAGAWNNRCWAHAKLDRLPAALADCDESLRLRPNHVETLENRALILLRMGHFVAAIADYDAALALNPASPGARYGRGVARVKTGDADGRTDMAAAKAVDAAVSEVFAGFGMK